jgi:hypothetical protein
VHHLAIPLFIHIFGRNSQSSLFQRPSHRNQPGVCHRQCAPDSQRVEAEEILVRRGRGPTGESEKSRPGAGGDGVVLAGKPRRDPRAGMPIPPTPGYRPAAHRSQG